MATGNSAFQLRTGTGWARGLDNLLRAELGSWFGTRTWWVQILIWAASVNLVLLFTVIGGATEETGDGAALFNVFMGLFPAVGVSIMMQSAVVGEKRSGTAAWVLSKPVSRTAFIVAKLVANEVGVAVTMVVAQGAIAYAILSFSEGRPQPILGFLAAMGVHVINLSFYLTLTLMLGAMMNHPAPVIAIPLAFLFSQQWLVGLLPGLANVLPWTLAVPPNNSAYASIAASLMGAGRPASTLPLLTVSGASVLFVVLAIRAFRRVEF